MARMKINMPTTWQFKTEIPIRVTDLNYGNHLANQNILGFAQEARLQYFKSHGFSELDFGGVSLIQADAAVTFLQEGNYGDVLTINVSAVQGGNSSFDVYYAFVNQEDKTVAHVRTAIVCYNYETKKVVAIPEKVINSGLLLTEN